MGRSVIGFGAFVGMTAGGFLPELWGSSSLSLASVLSSVVGAVAGIWVAVGVADV